jgi:CHAD domain-containing protein
MPYLRGRSLSYSAKQIKRIADALGQVRDQDVALIALEKLTQKAPPAMVPGINQFVEIRRQKCEEARTRLLKTIEPDILATLKLTFEDSLDLALESGPNGKRGQLEREKAFLTYREVARLIILVRLEDLERLSQNLYHPIKIKPIHEMRIAAKRLRYAIELFEHCWGKRVSPFAKRMAALQSSLGEVHDCDVWIESFGDDLSQTRKHRGANKEPAVTDDHATASVWLLGHFLKLRTRHFRNALARWCEWQENDLSAKLRKSLKAEARTRPVISDENVSAEVAVAATSAKLTT